MATLETLEQRVAALEQDMTRLKAGLGPQQPNEDSRGARLIREAAESHAELVAGWKKFLDSVGIQGEPIGAKKLRELMLAEGINPNDNAASREIVAMREE